MTYSIASEEHAEGLKRGLACLPPDFAARICGVCDGRGEYRQIYTAGCGGGYFKSMGACDYCDGTGLMQGRAPAPASVREQVLNAGRRNAI